MISVYVSSPLRLGKVNQSIEDRLLQEPDTEVFLPISLHTNHGIEENSSIVPRICYDMIKKCNVILLVIPYGLSTAAEIGYAQSRKDLGEAKTIIAFFSGLGITKKEDMIDYAIDHWVYSLEELVNLIGNLKKRMLISESGDKVLKI